MLKLYGAMMSRAHRVVWMLKELDLPFEHIQTNFLDGSTHHPDFLKINPNGRVPAVDDDGLLLCESLSINLYLARKHGGSLAPQSLKEEALATQWSFWVVTEVEKPLLFAAANQFLFPEAARNAEEAAMALARLDRPFAVLEAHLSSPSASSSAPSPYLLGEDFTVADLNVSVVMTLVLLAGINIERYPNMKAWLSRCLERPAAADWKSVRFTIPRPPTQLGILKMFL